MISFATMGHERFESKIKELRELITNSDDSDCSGIREFLDGDRELRAHLSSRNDWSRAGWLADPLTVAARRGKPQILAVLLRDYGLKVDASSVDGRTHDCNALDLAIAFNHPECVRVLLDHGSDIERAGILVGVPFANSFQLEQLMSERKIPLGPGARLREDKGIREMLEQEPGRRRGEWNSEKREMTTQLASLRGSPAETRS